MWSSTREERSGSSSPGWPPGSSGSDRLGLDRNCTADRLARDHVDRLSREVEEVLLGTNLAIDRDLDRVRAFRCEPVEGHVRGKGVGVRVGDGKGVARLVVRPETFVGHPAN